MMASRSTRAAVLRPSVALVDEGLVMGLVASATAGVRSLCGPECTGEERR